MVELLGLDAPYFWVGFAVTFGVVFAYRKGWWWR